MQDHAQELTIGFLPLIDCAPLVIANELGYFEAEGLKVNLSREKSWANIRDKLFVDTLQGAHMLAPMIISVSLGLNRVKTPLITSFSLNLNGNAITISTSLRDQMRALDPESLKSAHKSVIVLRQIIDQRREHGLAPLTFGTVYPYSCHNYLLRYWLAAAGIHPDHDINLVVIPPQQMAGQLAAGRIDGLCVGEPWNQPAVANGYGYNLLNTHQIWENAPEKVLAVKRDWAERNPETHLALLRGLLGATQWLAEPDHYTEAVVLLGQPHYMDVPQDVIGRGLKEGRHIFHRYHANFPWRSHALWVISQMIRWGQITHGLDICELAEATYQPDLYRQACKSLDLPCPAVDYKPEGQHASEWIMDEMTLGADRFIDGLVFQPDKILDYASGFDISGAVIPFTDFSCCSQS